MIRQTTFDDLADALLVSAPAVPETPDLHEEFTELEAAILATPFKPTQLIPHAMRLARAAFDALDAPLKDTIKQAKLLHAAKDTDYGNSFGRSVQRYGFISALTRLSDKYNRLTALNTQDAAVKSESIKDTLFDTGNYALMTAVEAANYTPPTLEDTDTPHNPLADTIEGMLSTSYKERFRAEYAQLVIRTRRLCRALDEGTVALASPLWLINQQADTMKQLAGILETRATIESINIKD